MVASKLQKRRRADPPPPPAADLVTAHARARKPRAAAATDPPLAKRLRPAPAAKPTPPSPPRRQARISDLLAASRASRAAATGPPAIVDAPPHMDMRRPPAAAPTALTATTVQEASMIARARKPPLPPPAKAAAALAKPPLLVKPPAKAAVAKPPPFVPPPAAPKAVPVRKPTAAAMLSERPLLAKAASGKIKAPGGEALRYDRTLLPEKHSLLLDILGGLEQAETLLATRRTIPEFAAVRKIVASVTKRTFTMRHLSQLAALVPEAVAVLPPRQVVRQTTARSKAAVASAAALSARRNERLVIRLDDVTDIVNGVQRPKHSSKNARPRLGEAAARGRRRLLLTRLRKHAEDWHARFLRREGIKDFAGSIWHASFRPDRHIADLPAPPLYPPPTPAKSKGTPERVVAASAPAAPATTDASTADAEQPLSAVDDLLMAPVHGGAATSAPSSPSRKSADSIPSDLLARVRAREAAKAERALDAPAASERLVLAQLPATLDAVRSVLSSGGRSSMGWAALTAATAAAIPADRTVAEVAVHLDALTKLAAVWCEKRPLSGPRGGFAFRIVDDTRFAEARRAVVASNLLPRDSGLFSNSA